MSASILYIHGFNSAPASNKASQLTTVMGTLGLSDQLRVPALHHHPRQAILQLEQAIAQLGRPLLVGSSLGGYYATHLAERHGLKALNVAGHQQQVVATACQALRIGGTNTCGCSGDQRLAQLFAHVSSPQREPAQRWITLIMLYDKHHPATAFWL